MTSPAQRVELIRTETPVERQRGRNGEHLGKLYPFIHCCQSQAGLQRVREGELKFLRVQSSHNFGVG